mmetsp:Transcript_25861/g.72414  ORF Transcript_25861/g.72414 Transcript_25861/m.72414 type:complete len:498 (+) Transcript_25861:47-1540(+)
MGSVCYWVELGYHALVTFLYRLLVAPWLRQAVVPRGGRVAVVGGGIAGCGAAWSLSRAGYKVVLYESRETVGGNAKVNNWGNAGDDSVTGLSVLAWPKEYFRNYTQLLETLGVETVPVTLPFYVRDHALGDFAHGRAPPARFKPSLDRWNRLVDTVRRVGKFLNGPSCSFYVFSYLNPFNILPAYLTARLFGVSREFWEAIVVPVYSSSFLTKNIETIPCTVLPILDDMIPLGGVPKMTTWQTNSADVFRRLCSDFDVRTGRAVVEVRPGTDARGRHLHMVRDSNNDFEMFDAVVFACPADAAASVLRKPTKLQNLLLRAFSYVDDHDATFSLGTIHQDPSVIPDDLRDTLLQQYSNYIAVHRDAQGGAPEFENTFILSSWVPAVQAYVEGRKTKAPFLVTYNAQRADFANTHGTVSNMRAHPDLEISNMILAQLVGLVQGDRNIYFCGSYTTPGNGHDLSLNSGFIVAHHIGADYPFPGNRAAKEDFEKLRSLMRI